MLLSLSLTRVIELPELPLELAILGLLISVKLNAQSLMLSLATAVAVAGVNWNNLAHPSYGVQRAQHWLIPGLATLGAGAILLQLPLGPTFVGGALITGVLYAAVSQAEFIVVTRDDPRHRRAAFLLDSLGVILFIGGVFAIRAANLRAIFAVPAMFLASSVIAWRTLKLKGRGGPFPWALGLVLSQLAWGLHYWPIAPLSQGILLGMLLYSGIGLANAHLDRRLNLARLLEYAGFVLIGIVAAAVLG